MGRLSLLGLSYLRGAPPALSEQGSRFRPWPTLLALGLSNSPDRERDGPALAAQPQ